MAHTQFIKRTRSLLLKKCGDAYSKTFTYRHFNKLEKLIYRLRGIKIIDWKR